MFPVVFLAPLHGGAAPLIREVAVRPLVAGRLLLAGACGVLMTTGTDSSLFTPERPEIGH